MPARYTLEALCTASGVPARTIKEWIRKNVLARSQGNGRASFYSEHHLTAVRVVRHMRSAGAPLDAIRARISGRTMEELRELLPAALTGNVSPPLLSGSAPAIGARAQTLQAVELMEGLTLMVNAEREGARKVAEEIWRRYGGAW